MVSSILFIAFGFIALSASLTSASVGGYYGSSDFKRFQQVLTTSLIIQEGDILSSYYGAKGFKLINFPVVKVLKMDNCAHLKALYKPDQNVETQFHALSTWALLECQGKLFNDATLKGLRDVLDSPKSTTSDLRWAIETLTLLNQNIPNNVKLSQALQSKLKEDDSLPSLGHALHAAAILGGAAVKFAQDRVEDIVVQADEVDGKLLQWEGGLSVTSLLITGLLRLPNSNAFNQAQAEKLANYLITRKTVQTPRGVLALLEAAHALSDSKVCPVSISIAGYSQVTIDKPDLKIRVSDILGRPLKLPVTPVVAQSATRIVDDVVVLAKQPLIPGVNPAEFLLSLQLEPGFYRIALMAGSHSTSLDARVLGPITVQNLEIGLSDSDGSSAPKLTKLALDDKLKTNLQADSSQHLIVKFSLPRLVHQAFVRLYSGNKEIIFVAEADSSRVYKVDINLASELSQSGVFDVELILGDSVIMNPIRWVLGRIEVQLNQEAVVSKVVRGSKPEIKHLFRQPEKRPAEPVSLLFTAATAAPLLVLLALWLRIGVNFGNFTIIALPFHVGFGAILGLFTLFWMKLDMFTTCAWLIPVGGFTFLAGHRVLSHIASNKRPEKVER